MTNTDAPWRPSADDLADLTGCDHIELRPGGREEIVDGVSEGFPYALVYSQHDRYQGRSVPWHWHQELELFYVLEGPVDYATSHERLKAMIDYIGRHYDERIGVRDIAGSAFASERECYRTFGECLGVTPTHYLRDYRIQQACRMLAHTTRPIAAVASMVGMGSPSRFGQEFRSAMGCTPSEYRARWQDSNSSGRGRL